MRRTAFWGACLAAVATAAIGGAQVEQERSLGEPRRLKAGTAVCVNLPLNLAGLEMETTKAGEELAERIRAVGFASRPLGTLPACDAVVFTESTGHNRKTVEVDFRLVLSDEQVPRLCSSARGRSGSPASWHAALVDAFAEEARQIRDAQQKGMAVYAGALQN